MTIAKRSANPAKPRRCLSSCAVDVRIVIARLEKLFGRQVWRRWGDGLEELVATILSQNTSNVNSGRAYERLAAAFPLSRGRQPVSSDGHIDWNAVADASPSSIERAIRCAGLSRIKAPRIRAILRQVRADRGEMSLEFLGELPVQQAREYLTRFDGIGPKTAACILLFSFNHAILPVDTHIHRIAIRLRLIDSKTSAEAAHAALEAIVPRRQFYNFHILLIKHGRQICRAQRPRCHDCPLLSICPTGPKLLRQGRSAGSVRTRH